MGINGHLEIAEEPGRILYLVDYDRCGMVLEEALRLLFGLLGFGGEIEGDEPVIGK
jgi:hypothetical protein